jgi:hypothetical protein
VRQYFIHIHTSIRVLSQQLLNEILGVFSDRDGGREGKLSEFGFDFLITRDVLDILFEGRLAEEQLIGEDAETPCVNFLAISLVAQLFGRGVLQAADNSSPKA